MPEPEHAVSESGFIDALEALKRWSGASFATLSAKTRPENGRYPVLSVGLIHDRLRGRRQLSPSASGSVGRHRTPEEFIRHFVVACLRAREDVVTDTRTEADRWADAWARIRTYRDRAEDVPAQLPADLPSFVGRGSDLEALQKHILRRRPHSVVAVITGMAGVGKTTFAVHAAHRLAPEFPDGQIFLDLGGWATAAVIEPADALERLLDSLGVPSRLLPTGPGARAAMWRSRVHAKRMLIVLDNAGSAAQVEPLLPGGDGCLVLVTSRRSLRELDDVHTVVLDSLEQADAASLLGAAMDVEDGTLDVATADELTDLCGRLPLAIRVIGARLRSRPLWSPREMAVRLRTARDRLSELEISERGVYASFMLSYEQVAPHRRRVFRLLGLLPEPDFDAYAAAALTDLSVGEVLGALEELAEVNLVGSSPRTFRLHDLLAEFARGLTRSEETAEAREAACGRLLDYYRVACARAMDIFAPYEADRRPSIPDNRTTPPFDTQRAARDWLDRERTTVVALCKAEQGGRLRPHVCDISTTLFRYFELLGHASDAIALHGAAREAARGTGKPEREGNILISLAVALDASGRTDEAAACTREAEECYRRSTDPTGVVTARNMRGHIELSLGRLMIAEPVFSGAREFACEIDDSVGEAVALRNLAAVNRLRGESDRALDRLELALDRCLAAGAQVAEARIRTVLGSVLRRLGDLDRAADLLEHAMRMHTEESAIIGQSLCATELACLQRDRGEPQAALALHDGACRLADESAHLESIVVSRLETGRTIQLLGSPDRALSEYLEPALELASRHERPILRAAVHVAIADAYTQLAAADAAAEHRRLHRQIIQMLGEPGLDLRLAY